MQMSNIFENLDTIHVSNINVTTADVLHELRRRSKLSQKDMADLLEVGQSTLCQYENHNRKLSLYYVQKCGALFNIKDKELFSLTLEETKKIYVQDLSCFSLKKLKDILRINFKRLYCSSLVSTENNVCANNDEVSSRDFLNKRL